jgi:hypothetical protein
LKINFIKWKLLFFPKSTNVINREKLGLRNKIIFVIEATILVKIVKYYRSFQPQNLEIESFFRHNYFYYIKNYKKDMRNFHQFTSQLCYLYNKKILPRKQNRVFLVFYVVKIMARAQSYQRQIPENFRFCKKKIYLL